MTEFAPGPTIAELPPPPVKRGRGRPKGSKNRPKEDAPRRGRPPGGAAYRSRREEIGGILLLVNMGIQASPLRNDALDPLEIDALASAIDAEAKRNPTFRKYLFRALGVASGVGGIGATVGIIVMRRAARHGIIPQELDAQGAMILGMMSQSNAEPIIPEPEPESPPEPIGA